MWSCSLIVGVSVVLRRTVVGSSDWRLTTWAEVIIRVKNILLLPVLNLHEVTDQTVSSTALDKISLSVEELFRVHFSVLLKTGNKSSIETSAQTLQIKSKGKKSAFILVSCLWWIPPPHHPKKKKSDWRNTRALSFKQLKCQILSKERQKLSASVDNFDTYQK